MFQKLVGRQPAIGTKGDFADAGIRAVVLAGPGALVSAPSPRSPIVGNFGWGDQATGQAFSRFFGEATAKIGFIHRENQAIIVPFLADNQSRMEAGFPVILFDQGSFWALFGAGATVGQKVFANYLDGSVYAAAAGTSTTVASAMTGSIAAVTGILTISGLTGALAVGNVLSGGVVPAGTAITAQLTGAAGGIGTYQTSITTAVANLTSAVAAASVETNFFVDSNAFVDAVLTGSIDIAGVLTVTAVASGIIVPGQYLQGVGVTPSTFLLAQLTSTEGGGALGGRGTYSTNQAVGPVVGSETLTATQGQLAKISTWS